MRSPAIWLTALVGVSALVRAAISLRVPSPWILPDEIVYSDLAKSIADGSRPAIRGIPVFGWGEVYPTLISPAWALFGDPTTAYRAALVINAVAMSSAAVPAYFLARLFVPPKASLLAATMTVLVPSMVYTGLVMTENAFYPVFLLSVLLITRAVGVPTLANQALAILGLVLVAFTRIQGLALVAAYLGAIVLYAWTSPRSSRRPYLRRFLPSAVLAVSASLAPAVLSTASGEGPFGWLGARSGTFDAFRASEVPQWFAFLAGGMVLYVAVGPAVATALVSARGLMSAAPERLRLFASVTIPTIAAMLLAIALVSSSFEVDGAESLNERYVFYVAPLAFIGLALWVQGGLLRPRPWAAVAVVVCCVLPVALPVRSLAYTAEFQSLALFPWVSLEVSGVAFVVTVAGFTATCAAVWATSRRDTVGRVWLLTGGVMVVVGAMALVGHHERSTQAATPVRDGHAKWVDDAVPNGTNVAVVWDEPVTPGRGADAFYPWLMLTEFYNARVGVVYRIGAETHYEKFLPTVPAAVGDGGTIAPTAGAGEPIAARYVLTTCRLPLEGVVVARSLRGSLTVTRVDGPVRVARRPGCVRRTP